MKSKCHVCSMADPPATTVLQRRWIERRLPDGKLVEQLRITFKCDHGKRWFSMHQTRSASPFARFWRGMVALAWSRD